MSLATIVTILGIVNTLLTIAKELPDVIDEAKSLLAKIEPHVLALNEPTGSITGVFATLKGKLP
jgi:hypothetical protein